MFRSCTRAENSTGIEKKKEARKNVGMIKPNETVAVTSRGGGGAGAVSVGVKVKVSSFFCV